jgi:hypothetical protein
LWWVRKRWKRRSRFCLILTCRRRLFELAGG